MIYTSPTGDSPLQSLIHASLGIHSLLKRAPLKHNVIDRDKIVVPPNWDSTSKIMVLRDGFDVDAISNGWSIDISQRFEVPQKPVETVDTGDESEGVSTPVNGTAGGLVQDPEGSAVVMYEAQVQDSSLDALHLAQQKQDTTKLEVEAANAQDFLATLVPRVEAEKRVDEEEGKQFAQNSAATEEIISDHIGPVQFNMGGIQVDADDMVQRLKVSLTLQSSRALKIVWIETNGNYRSVNHIVKHLNQLRTRRRSSDQPSQSILSGWHSFSVIS